MLARTPSPHFDTLESLITYLSDNPEREPIAAELGALQSIYGDDAVRLWHPPSPPGADHAQHAQMNGGEKGTIRYEVSVSIAAPADPDSEYPLTVLVSLPPAYPVEAPPQLQLLSRYLGPFGVDAALFGAVLRTYISRDAVEWTAGGVCVFDGVEWVRERCAIWAGERLSAARIGELIREDERPVVSIERPSDAGREEETVEDRQQDIQMPNDIELVVSDPIVDRKSVFIGRACRISDPAQVPTILAHLMSDRKIARAAHPIINAWRCRLGNTLHQDNDDDGETAAGGRLAHLLQILEVENVLVVVTRYFGGIHLGPDRFKHINQAARNALELGRFLDIPEPESHGAGRRKGKAGSKR
ncbi:uncharacterized protein FIBRA_00248 [Fibroporia radiculosa]|uniref:RWD domain-containing protein n=1 Tax=Fibroporia radiculosa TaxID=599839 RepID=J7S5V7_9APHY|nr:uncharacterized protein FIBRA_00248 [Fibroporia radiculosa]CCL98254.1 predicted protein [Fibroporia radiculosa]